jgi:predicted outer membrane repeat protein
LLWFTLSFAGITYVSPTGDDSSGDGTESAPFATIAKGIVTAGWMDTVLLEDGTYHEHNLVPSHGGTIASRFILDEDPGHIDACVVDGDSTGDPRGSVFYVEESAGSSQLALKGFTIIGGTGSPDRDGDAYRYGGAICVQREDAGGAKIQCRLDLQDMVFRNNYAKDRGGAIANAARITAKRCVFEGNSAGDYGGVIAATLSGYPTALWDFDNCTFSNNTAVTCDGGVFCGATSEGHAVCVLDSCTVNGNSCGRYGGVFHQGTDTARSCTFYDNYAQYGTILWSPTGYFENCRMYNNGDMDAGTENGLFGAPRFVGNKGCTMYGNEARTGAIMSQGSGRLTNCLIYGNTGDCVIGVGDTARLINCTIAGNNTDVFDISLPAPDRMVEMNSCIFLGRMYNGHQAEVAINYTLTDPYNLSYIHASSTGNLTGIDPLFVDTASGDYHLMSYSRLIDAGDPGLSYTFEPGDGGGRVNIGAYGNTEEAAVFSTDATMAFSPAALTFTAFRNEEVDAILQITNTGTDSMYVSSADSILTGHAALTCTGMSKTDEWLQPGHTLNVYLAFSSSSSQLPSKLLSKSSTSLN